MGQNLEVVFISPVDGRNDLLGCCGGVTGVARGVVANGSVVGAVAPGCEALRRAVDRQLGATHPEAVCILWADVVLDEVTVDQDVRKGNDIDFQFALVGHGFQ